MLPALQKLSICHCPISSDDLAALRLPQLTCLTISTVYVAEGSSSLQEMACAVVELLQRLPLLAELEVSGVCGSYDVVPLSTMQHLRSCILAFHALSLARVLCAPALTSLTLEQGSEHVLAPSILPPAGFPSLRALSVCKTQMYTRLC